MYRKIIGILIRKYLCKLLKIHLQLSIIEGVKINMEYKN